MVATGRKFTAKPEGTDVRRILVAHAMGHKSGVRNGHKILRGFATGPAKSEGVFADGPLGFKSNVLQDNRITHKSPPSPQLRAQACAQAPLKIDQEGSKNYKTTLLHHGTLMRIGLRSSTKPG